MRMRGGVIIIGSLLWDNGVRRRWRDANLDAEEKILAHLPIRYGRLSDTRNDTYTMVFSKACYWKTYGLGSGWIVPLQDTIETFESLKVHARKMGDAERFSSEFASSWGSVALLTRPGGRIDQSVYGDWRKFMHNRISKHPKLLRDIKTQKILSEGPSIDKHGVLRLKWPTEIVSGRLIENLDFLLATVTMPKLAGKKDSRSRFRYPSSKEIADAMTEHEYWQYFRENRDHCITTFQDRRILRRKSRHTLL